MDFSLKASMHEKQPSKYCRIKQVFSFSFLGELTELVEHSQNTLNFSLIADVFLVLLVLQRLQIELQYHR